jgi:hypothetical protein
MCPALNMNEWMDGADRQMCDETNVIGELSRHDFCLGLKIIKYCIYGNYIKS